MPVVTIEGPKLDLETKRVLVKDVTDALEKAYRFPRHVYGIIIRENAPENVANGGELVLDRKNRQKTSA
ncbi:MAG TPA: tautomerase family protein [Candidatus Omnitrophota bacterium]|nr:tautomerase family protein [Candidatus Omnitrophota bacterium]HQL41045.1 tautomerase family protein [Candidatus Omnitrophota bacterium]